MIGVNGSGKTTTIGKLGHWLKEQDYGVLLAAGDTFRAAAIEQLQIWGQRIGAPVISGKEGGDAAGIVFDGVGQATETGIDALIVDTAGRLQNKAIDGGMSKIPARARADQSTRPPTTSCSCSCHTNGGKTHLRRSRCSRDSAGVTAS